MHTNSSCTVVLGVLLFVVIKIKRKNTLELVGDRRKQKISFDSLTATGRWIIMVWPDLESSLFTFSTTYDKRGKATKRSLWSKIQICRKRLRGCHASIPFLWSQGLEISFRRDGYPQNLPSFTQRGYLVQMRLFGFGPIDSETQVDAVARNLFAL